MTKCTLCVDRIHDEQLPQEDRKPACVKACPTGARLFGDVKDPDSEVSIAIRERGGYSLMPEWETKPANQYLPRRITEVAGAPARPARRRPSRSARREPGLLRRLLHDPRRRRAGPGRRARPGRARRRGRRPGLHRGDARRRRRACSWSASAASFLHLGRPERAWRAATDVAHLVAVARGDRAAGVHRRRRAVVGGRADGRGAAWTRVALPARRARRRRAALATARR